MIFTATTDFTPKRKGLINSESVITVANQFGELMAERATTIDLIYFIKDETKDDQELSKAIKQIISKFLETKEESCFESNWRLNGSSSVKTALENFVKE